MKLKILVSSFLLSSLAALTSCSGNRGVVAAAPETVRDVAVIKVQEQPTPDTFTAVGTVRASRSAQLAAQVMGSITAVNAREGDAVKQGQVLVSIDDAQARAGVDQAQAGLAAAGHELAGAEAELALAQATFNRLQTLYDKKSLSMQEHDEIKARLQSATAHRETARSNRAQSAAALEQARTAIGHARLRAPFDGMVTERRVDPGALATPGMPLLTVEARDLYRLEATVDERDLKYVRLGAGVPVTLDSDAGDGQPLNGRVAQIVPAADAASRSFLIKIDLPRNNNLRSGSFGRAVFNRGPRQAVLIPQAAVIERGQLQSIYVLSDQNVATLRYVTLGSENEKQREVLSGLSPGETIVAAPAGRELAGKRIEVR
jgi:RND family efflux transporter MFP subunit